MVRILCTALLLSIPTTAAAHNVLGFETITYSNRGACEAGAGQMRALLRNENRNYDVFCEPQGEAWVLHVHELD